MKRVHEKVAIIGSRTFPHPEWARRCVERYVLMLLDSSDAVVSGGARGVDSWAADAARQRGLQVIEHLPDWDKHGKGAGFKRNYQIVFGCDRVVAFWDGSSKGTAHTLSIARSEQKEVLVIEPEKHIPEGWYEDADRPF
jgi:hypothetical protein